MNQKETLQNLQGSEILKETDTKKQTEAIFALSWSSWKKTKTNFFVNTYLKINYCSVKKGESEQITWLLWVLKYRWCPLQIS